MRVTKKLQAASETHGNGIGKAKFRRAAEAPTCEQVSRLLRCAHEFHAATAASRGLNNAARGVFSLATSDSGSQTSVHGGGGGLGSCYDRVRKSRGSYATEDTAIRDRDRHEDTAFGPVCGTPLPKSSGRSSNTSYGVASSFATSAAPSAAVDFWLW